MAFTPIDRKHGKGKTRHAPMSEINVTPLVDVMLVLLIVFMVTAPLLSIGVPVNLPKAQAQTLQTQTEPLTISVNAAGVIFIEEQEVALTNIIAQLNAISEGGTERRIYVRGDAQVPYGRMAQIVSYISAAGFTRVALVTQTPSISGGAK